MTIRDWRALQESYRGLWRDRRNGQAELHTLDFVRGDAGWPTERVA